MKSIALVVLGIIAFVLLIAFVMGGPDGTPAIGLMRKQIAVGFIIVGGFVYYVATY